MSKPNTEKMDEIPSEFSKVVYDLTNDILFTFPEYRENMNVDLFNIKETKDEESIRNVYEHIKKVMPERFFDILYKNEDMFTKGDVNTEFLPGIHFKDLWSDGISDKTKETIWKYLQLILFTVIGKLNADDSFGDTAKLFETINEDELKGKLEETLNNFQNMMDGDDPIIDVSGIDMNQLPKPDEIQDHIKGLLDGKLGKLAREIAEETAGELNLDAENATSVNDVFKNLFKNPGKLMNLVQNVGGKLDSKIKSGEINESEIMAEASGLLSKMKDMPGMGDIQAMMSKMGMNPGRGGGGNFDLSAMTNSMEQNMKMAQMKERMKQRGTEKQAAQEAERVRLQNLPEVKQLSNKELEELVFSIEGDKPEKTMRDGNNQTNKKKKKKGKKK
ncbi:hypothetical protein N8261_05845 [Flavobacteriaceae bacterium]|nr:hypothetical protein [Flavobacteriaceae bacterium]